MYEECDKSTLTQEQLPKSCQDSLGGRWSTRSYYNCNYWRSSRKWTTSTFCCQRLQPTCRRPHGGVLRSCTIIYQPEDTTTTWNTTRTPNYLPRHLYSLHQYTTTTYRRNLRPTTSRMVLQLPLQHYGASRRRCTDYVRHQSCGNNTWGSTTPTKSTTMQADRCLWTTPGLGVLIYVDDLLLVGETTRIQHSS